MFKPIAILLIGTAQVSIAADAQVSDLPGVFAATCLDGQARLSARDVTKIGFGDLPLVLRDQLGPPESGTVWRLNATGNSYLYVLNYAPGRDVNPKICGLASDEMSLDSASELLELRLADGTSKANARSTQWVRAEDGYVAVATRAGKFSVAQVNWLSDEERADLMADFQSLPH